MSQVAKPAWNAARSGSAEARRWFEAGIHGLLFACAGLSVLTTVGIVLVLFVETAQFFTHVSVVEFLTSTRWSPLIKPNHFGILPLLCGTFWVAAVAAALAIPIGLASAIFLSEYAHPRVRDVIKPVLEVLAGIPSVVYGYLAVIVISPVIKWFLPGADILNAVSAGVVVGIMILPTVASLSEDVLRSVPRALREAAYALGSTKFDVTCRVVVPAGLSGIMASFLLAISRAVGETMAVALAAGSTPTLTHNPFKSVQTMTAFIVQISGGDTPTGTIEYQTIFAVGTTLFLITLGMNILARWILSRFREVYD